MAITLSIDKESCIRCGRCVRVCPALIFTREVPGSAIGLQGIEGCIGCGHCVAACPESAVLHSEFPSEKVHPVAPALLPTPEQTLLLMRARRSNRAFSSKPVPVEMLDLILEAAHRAPTASNMQQVEFTLVTDPVKLRRVSELTIDTFSAVEKKLTSPLVKPFVKAFLPELYKLAPRFRVLRERFEGGYDPILRGAQALLFIHTPSKNRFGCEDANLAYQNGSLMAESLGVSQFYTGFVCSAVKQDKEKRIAALLGIGGTIHAGMALGMTDFRFPNYIDRNDLKVNRIL